MDKKLNEVSTLTDFDYALIVKGTDVAKVSKDQLASVLGVMKQVYDSPLNADDCLEPGAYSINNNRTLGGLDGSISPSGILLVFKVLNVWYAQIYLPDYGTQSALAIRVKYSNNKWGPWSRLAATQIL